MTRALYGILLFFMCIGCDGGPHRPVAQQSGPLSPTSALVTYNDVRPIFQKFCSTCHPGKGPGNWLDYNQVLQRVRNGRLHERVIVKKDMPLKGSPEAAAITEADRQTINQWILAGGPSAKGVTLAATPADTGFVDQSGDFWRLTNNCFGCHGVFGFSSTPGIPSLAGQNAFYILDELREFKSRKRIDPKNLMNPQAEQLSEDAMKFAAYFFDSLKHLTPITEGLVLSDDEKEQLEQGRKLALSEDYNCNGCHAISERTTVDPSIPHIYGQDRVYLHNQLTMFKANQRGEVMPSIVESLSPEDLAALALYYSQSTYEEPPP